MQLYAINSEGVTTHAMHADKHTNHTCLECGKNVRLRNGLHRQHHFYHLQINQNCKLYGKKMDHLMIQCYLKSLLSPNTAYLEHRFPLINRIADIAWIEKRIVFEIQCSPITALEIKARNADYASMGFQVVWILHDLRYNQYRLSGAEDALQNWPHYFTNIDSLGEGMIYDQFAFIFKGIRMHRLPRLAVDLSGAFPLANDPFLSILHFSSEEAVLPRMPQFILKRLKEWPLYFRGDCLDACKNQEISAFLTAAFDGETAWNPLQEQSMLFYSLPDFIKMIYKQWIALPYRALLRLILERTSR